MQPRLLSKTAVVTGASTGIGQAIAHTYAQHGARVGLHYHRSSAQAETLAREIAAAGGQATLLQADLAQADEAERLAETAWERMGRIDIWANIAGADVLTGEGAQLSDRDKLDRLFAVDLRATMLCCWKIAPLMKQAGGGAIINMSWDLATQGLQGRNPQIFAAIKAGILGFSKSLARSYAPEVRVNDLAPGFIETAFAREAMSPEYYQWVIEQTPMRRFGTPEDVAQAALYLASDEAAFITGQTIKINGGWVS
jgi:3-oxoacyl-[acyl-carrier protein] reductase